MANQTYKAECDWSYGSDPQNPKDQGTVKVQTTVTEDVPFDDVVDRLSRLAIREVTKTKPYASSLVYIDAVIVE